MFVIELIILYFLLVFVGIRLVVPYYGFQDIVVPIQIPDDFQLEIDKLNKTAKTHEEFLQMVYNFLTERYHGSRFEIFAKWRYAFEDPFTHRSGFLPCTVLNELLGIMLVTSGRFSQQQVRKKVVFLNFFIHQYVQVEVDGKWINIDVAYSTMGVPFGKRAFLFA